MRVRRGESYGAVSLRVGRTPAATCKYTQVYLYIRYRSDTRDESSAMNRVDDSWNNSGGPVRQLITTTEATF